MELALLLQSTSGQGTEAKNAAASKPDASRSEDHSTDFIVSSPDWPYPQRRGKVVLYSGKTFSPIVEICGERDGAVLGWQAAIVGDCDEDGIPDIAYTAQVEGAPSWRVRMEVCSGRTGKLLHTIAPTGVGDAEVFDCQTQLNSRRSGKELVIGQRSADHGGFKECGLVRIVDPHTGRTQSEVYGSTANLWLGNLLFTVTGESESKGVLIVGFTTGPSDRDVLELQGTTELRGLGLPASVRESAREVNATSSHLVKLNADAGCSVLLLGCPSYWADDQAANRVYAYDVSSRSLAPDYLELHGEDQFGQSVAVAHDQSHLLRGVFVGAPDWNVGQGAVWFYTSLKGTGARRVSSNKLDDHFGQTLQELGDVDGDGITDVVAIGTGMDCQMEHGFAVLSGATGSVLSEHLPVRK